MDGNRRWAKYKNLPTLQGHKEGFERFKETIEWADEFGIKNLIFYGFSTENWKRTKTEVSYLMKIFEGGFDEIEKIHKNKFRIKFIGRMEDFSDKLQNLMRKTEEDTKSYSNGTIIMAVSYGGRSEITQAVNKILKEKKSSITEEDFEKHLWTKDTPDPDIIIRTGGETRLSNFLPWQSVYSELYFIKTYWPDFSKEEFKKIIDEFGVRDRRMGK